MRGELMTLSLDCGPLEPNRLTRAAEEPPPCRLTTAEEQQVRARSPVEE